MDADDCFDIGMEDLAAAILANDIFSSPYGESGSTLTPMTDIQHRQLHTAQDDTSSDTAPDTQRQVVRDTPIYLSRHARLASRPVREPGSEPDSVARAGLTVAGLAILRAQHMVVGPQTPDLTSNTSPIRAGQHRAPEHYPRISFPGPCGVSHPEPAPC